MDYEVYIEGEEQGVVLRMEITREGSKTATSAQCA